MKVMSIMTGLVAVVVFVAAGDHSATDYSMFFMLLAIWVGLP